MFSVHYIDYRLLHNYIDYGYLVALYANIEIKRSKYFECNSNFRKWSSSLTEQKFSSIRLYVQRFEKTGILLT